MISLLPPEQGPGPGWAGLGWAGPRGSHSGGGGGGGCLFDVPSDTGFCNHAQGDLTASPRRE